MSLNSENANTGQKDEEEKISDEFQKVITDFVQDLKTSFPEYLSTLNNYYDGDKLKVSFLYDHAMKEFPEKFFDILYENEELFSKENDNKKEFLPNLDFVILWHLDDITQNIKDKIWKYLQLILFSVISQVKSNECFGDTAKLFEAIDENEFKEKLEQTVESMSSLFGDLGKEFTKEQTSQTNEETNNEQDEETHKENNSRFNFSKSDLPDPEEIHSHISSMMEGKLGKLATEIAEETASEMNLNMENVNSQEDVFKQLFKNPTKLMSLVKKVGGKLDSKIKSGDIKESELMDEASELMKKMKNMPGMDNIQEMLKKMNIPGMGKKARFNTAAFERMQKMEEKKQEVRERLRKKQEEKTMNEQLEELKKKFQNISPEEQEKRDKELMELIKQEEDEEKKSKSETPSKNKKKKKKKGKK